MCFSATASFAAGAALTAIGIASIKKTKTPAQIPFASIPFIFALQQISEGFVWLSLTDPVYASLEQFSTCFFLFFAQIFWPVWVPFSILKIEPFQKRIKHEKILLVAGMAVSLYFIYCQVAFPFKASISGYHILYILGYPEILTPVVSGIYAVATIIPTLISGIRRLWVFGIAVLASYLITFIFYTKYLVSVWCFFAAIISIIIYVIMLQLYKTGKTPLKVSTIVNNSET